jgi:hypothetical protein
VKSHLKVRVNANMYLNYACRVSNGNGEIRSAEVRDNALAQFIASGMRCSLELTRQTVGNLIIREVTRYKNRVKLVLDSGSQSN